MALVGMIVVVGDVIAYNIIKSLKKIECYFIENLSIDQETLKKENGYETDI